MSVLSCSEKTSSEITLRIAVAANMTEPMDSIVEVFESKYGVHCEVLSNASGTLCAQIEQGAPFDVFVSADRSYPDYLYNKGIAEEPVLYAKGRLVLVSHSSMDDSDPIEVLLNKEIKKLAIAFPKNAPYGEAAMEVISHLGLNEQLEDKFVFGESVAQVNQLFASTSVDVAFTSYSYVMSSQEPVNFMKIDPRLHSEIDQSAVIIKTKEDKLKAQKEFMDFLVSAESKNILNYYGYQ